MMQAVGAGGMVSVSTAIIKDSFNDTERPKIIAMLQMLGANGPNSLRFHYSPKCVGLKNCFTRLEKISISEARKRGRTLCGHEK